MNKKKLYIDKNSLPKKVILSGILIILKECINITYTEEYERIYKPIDSYLISECKLYFHNMWGYGERGIPWQMDGRHRNWDYIKNEK